MLHSWSIPLLIFSVALAEARGKVKDGNDPPARVKEIITSVNAYLEDHDLTTVPLLDITPGFGFLHITHGKLGMFNTIHLQKEPVFRTVSNKDGTTTYLFNVSLGLNPLLVHYKIELDLFAFTKKGGVTITPQSNTLQVKGNVVIGTSGRCTAALMSVGITNMEDFKIEIDPDDFPFITKTNQAILNFLVPKLLPLANIAIDTAALLPNLNAKFGELVCKNISVTNDIK